jgi:hypothetical protein
MSLQPGLLWQWGWLDLRHRHGFNTFLNSADYGRKDHAVAYAHEHDAEDVNEAELFMSSDKEVDETAERSNEDGEHPPKGFSSLEGFNYGHDITNEANDASNECEDSS